MAQNYDWPLIFWVQYAIFVMYLGRKRALRMWVCSSVGERFLDAEEAGGSIPPRPTTYLNDNRGVLGSVVFLFGAVKVNC